MSRLIDADALWMDIIHSMDYCEDILEFIDNAPTVPQWIPCSERLPELIEDVLICFSDGEFEISFLDKDLHGKTFWAYGLNSNDIVAWMPLPEPYKEADT